MCALSRMVPLSVCMNFSPNAFKNVWAYPEGGEGGWKDNGLLPLSSSSSSSLVVVVLVVVVVQGFNPGAGAPVFVGTLLAHF